MPSLEQLEQKFQGKGLKILMINTRESRETVEPYIRRNSLSFHVLLDSEGKVAEKFSVFGLPTAFLIDKQGKAVSRSIGYRNWNTQKMHETFTLLIEE
jgi:peroxiredoxin